MSQNQYQITNDAINVSLAAGESITVPDNEVWKLYVNYFVFLRDNNRDYNAYANVDGVRCIGYRARAPRDEGSSGTSHTEEIILRGGQTFEVTSVASGRFNVSGYVIDEEYEQ